MRLSHPKKQTNCKKTIKSSKVHFSIAAWICDLICFVEDFLNFRPSDCRICWKSFECLSAVLPPQPGQEAQDQGQLPAHDDVCWYGQTFLPLLSNLTFLMCMLSLNDKKNKLHNWLCRVSIIFYLQIKRGVF